MERRGEERRSKGSEIMIVAYLKFGKKRKLRTDGDYREKRSMKRRVKLKTLPQRVNFIALYCLFHL